MIDSDFECSQSYEEKNGEFKHYFGPVKVSYREKSKTSEGDWVKAHYINERELDEVRKHFKGYFKYIEDFIEDMKKVFPTLKNDWGIYIPEVKYLSPEPLVNYKNLSLTEFPNVYFVGDALSARGITVSGAQGTYVAESLIKNAKLCQEKKSLPNQTLKQENLQKRRKMEV
jgi:hypothetical protein